MSQLGGGLRWSGVSKTGSTASQRIMNQSKAIRQKEAMSAPKVGSAAVVEADDWLAAAAANQAQREKRGATGNPFESAEAVVKEAKRQAVDEDDEFAIEPKRARVQEDADEDEDARDLDELEGEGDPSRAPEPPKAEDLSREQKREIELSVFELRDELEDEGLDEDAIDAQCDNLREKLLEKARG